MILDMLVDVPDLPGLITKRSVKGVTYVYYEYGREYDPKRKYTLPKRATIGKLDASGRLMPNENFRKYLPSIPLPDEGVRCRVSSCLRIGTFLLIKKMVAESRLELSLDGIFNERGYGLLLDLATYSIVTENNAAQYYPDYAYSHPVFTPHMRRYSDSTVSRFLAEIDRNQTSEFLERWNMNRDKKDRIYVSYDSSNKNCQAGDIDMVEYGHAKEDRGTPIFNFSIAYDQGNCEPLFYEEYPGSVVDVSQLQFMLMKADGFGYGNISFILDRGYFSRGNIAFMDEHGFEFIIMVRGMRRLVAEVVNSVRCTFESDRDNYVKAYGVYGTTVKAKLYAEDTRERYLHVIYNPSKLTSERMCVDAKIDRMERFLEKCENREMPIPGVIGDYFELFYDGDRFLYGKVRKDVVKRELDLCGYFVIVTSEKMTAAEAVSIYKGRDSTEKLFRGDKSYLGNRSLRVCSDEAASSKIFIEFIALIIRNRIHSRLKNAKLKNEKKQNFMNVSAAIRELEKIEMIRRPDGRYALDHAVTATQKEILHAFGLDEKFIMDGAAELSAEIARFEKEKQDED